MLVLSNLATCAEMALKGENLMGLVSKEKSHCLNESAAHPWKHLLGGGGLVSDADEQLLLTLALNQTVRLTGLSIGLPLNETCPHKIKLFINNENLGFDEAGERPPTQELVIADPGQSTFDFNLQAVKWQRTDSISLFVESNHGAGVSSITSVAIYGSTINGTDVSKIKGC